MCEPKCMAMLKPPVSNDHYGRLTRIDEVLSLQDPAHGEALGLPVEHVGDPVSLVALQDGLG